MSEVNKTPVSELLREVCDRIERGEVKGNSLAEQSDLYGLRESLVRWLPRLEEIERPEPSEE